MGVSKSGPNSLYTEKGLAIKLRLEGEYELARWRQE